MGPAGEVRYLTSLLGKIGFILSAAPGDIWFTEAKEAVKSLLREAAEPVPE